MDTERTFILDVNERINKIFINIIDDLPMDSNGKVIICKKNYLSVTDSEAVVEYGAFCKSLYEFVSIYIPSDKENPLIKTIKMLPRTIKNIKIINLNKEIIVLQNHILDKYFLASSKMLPAERMNIKEKILEFKDSINEILYDDENDEEMIKYLSEKALSSFDERIRTTLLNDLNRLSELMKRRSML